jgi:hypothetical protein
MDKKREAVYVVGIVCLLCFILLSILAGNFTITIGWSIASVISWVFAGVFGVFGFGSLLKPDSFGVIVLRLMEALAESQGEGSDLHNKQIQKKSNGSVQVMASDSEVNINVLPRKQKQARKSDVKGSALWKPLPKIKFHIAQSLPLRKLQFPQVGWEAYNDSPYQLRVRIEIHPILGGHDLFPLSDDDINGTYVYPVEPMSALFGNGCFSLPRVCATSEDELILEIRAKAEDINDTEKGEYKFLSSRWKYVREHDAWSYYPQRPTTRL